MRGLIAALAALAAASASPAASSCCAWGGSGSAQMAGSAVMSLAAGVPAVQVPMVMGVDAENKRVVILVNNSDPSLSAVGWIIQGEDDGNQTLTVWTNGEVPQCSSSSVAAPAFYAPGFNVCPGVAGSLFQTFIPAVEYPLTASTTLNMAVQVGFSGEAQASLMVTDAGSGCVPTCVSGGGTPLGEAAWSFTVVSGGPVAPPAAWFAAPPACASA